MVHLSGSLTYTFDNSAEFDAALIQLNANLGMDVVSSDAGTLTITVSIDVDAPH